MKYLVLVLFIAVGFSVHAGQPAEPTFTQSFLLYQRGPRLARSGLGLNQVSAGPIAFAVGSPKWIGFLQADLYVRLGLPCFC
jgi:hypothetical protein